VSQQLFQGLSPESENQHFLERPRVDRLLAKALQSHVVTVVAGEGSGKTHAMTSFLQRDPRNTIWVQISERDNLGWRFWENYTGEVARLNPEAAKIFADIGFPDSGRQLDRYLSMVKDDIISHDQYVLVFDDFHLLTNPSVLLVLDQVLAAPVSKNIIVFISRTEPAINTLNLLAKGLLFQITVEDLRFTREETDEYFCLHRIFLEEEELERIYQETEGWALALGLIRQGIQTDRIGGRSWDRVMLPIKKMEENIFSAMEAGLQRFLIKLSLIEHWPRNFLERLEPGGKHISAMENLSSVIRFDVYLHGFRIHPLFLDFLREKQDYLSREEIREVCGKGAQWCIENNLPTDAAVNYEQARDYGGFIRLINSLPRILPRTVASFFLNTTERLLAENPEDGENWDFLFLRFTIRPRLLALLERFDEVAKECQAAITCFEAQSPSPNRSRILCAAYNNLGFLSIFTSKYTRDYTFAHWFEQGHRYYLENPEPIQGLMNQSNIGSYVIQVGFPAAPGEIDAFIAAYSAAVPYIAASMGGYRFGTDTLARSELAYYQGDLNKAEQFARQAIYQGREKGQYEVENRALFYLMRIGIRRGDITEIRELERQMEVQMEKGEYPYRDNIHDVVMGRFYTRLGLTEKIAPWLRTENEGEELNVFFRGFDSLVKALCLFIEKDYPSALRVLTEEQARGDLGSSIFGMLEMTILEAVVRHRLGDQEGAFSALNRAYDAACPNNLNMPFIELGEPICSLVNALLKVRADKNGGPENLESPEAGREIPEEWLRTIRRDASAYAKKRSLVAAQYSGRDTAAAPAFSNWEREILNNLSQGRTVEELATGLNISVNMVKSAIRSVYAKLGAVNRADAIRIATSKGLLTGLDSMSKPPKNG
jgi:LuxR family maltose regulon positive regulatory protein